MSKWDDVDPRVEWAMKIFDQEGQDFESEAGHLVTPVTLSILPPASMAMLNWTSRMPLKSNILPAIAAMPVFFWVGTKVNKHMDAKRATQNAAIKHYVMTHPERFPEPKRIKYIDFIQPFHPYRR